MSDILARIGAYKREEIAAAKRLRPLAALESEAKAARRAARLLALPSSGGTPAATMR